MERWKDIIGYKGLYQISDFGRILSLDRKYSTGNNIMRENFDTKGYIQVKLFKNGINKMYSVHRLVGIYFIYNPLNLPCINHKNEIKDDNIYTNLEWCTHVYNNSYGTRIKRQRDAMINGKLSKKVYQYSLDDVFIKEYPSASEVGRVDGFSHSAICRCCLGQSKTYANFKWSYIKL